MKLYIQQNSSLPGEQLQDPFTHVPCELQSTGMQATAVIWLTTGQNILYESWCVGGWLIAVVRW